MSGADIIGALLRDDAAVTGKVVEANIKGGMLPENAPLPSLLVRVISTVDRQPLKRVGWVRTTDRVSVTTRAATYRDQKDIIRLVRLCCLGRTGDIGGGARVAITSAGAGPDLIGPGSSFERAHDFRVSFDEPAA